MPARTQHAAHTASAGRRSTSQATSSRGLSSIGAAATSCSRATGSTSRSSMPWRLRASATRRSAARRSRPSIAARPRGRSCSGRRGSRTCSRAHARARSCRRKPPTSSPSSPRAFCFNHLTDWLATCRAAVEDVRGVLAELPTRVEREPVVGAGKGGDETVAIDAAAEDAIVRRLETTGADFTLISEELGERTFGSGGPTHVVVDPIDGSLNAKRGIPFFALSLAVADGATMDDVHFGYVYDFGTGEEWTAERGAGAFLDAERLGAVRPKDEIEILSFEATLTSSVAEKAAQMVGLAYRLRIMGSLAITLCHLAAGRVDAVCSLKGARSVDIAAAQLLVRGRGLAIDLPEAPPFDRAPLDSVGRSRVVAAGTPKLCQELFTALDR